MIVEEKALVHKVGKPRLARICLVFIADPQPREALAVTRDIRTNVGSRQQRGAAAVDFPAGNDERFGSRLRRADTRPQTAAAPDHDNIVRLFGCDHRVFSSFQISVSCGRR